MSEKGCEVCENSDAENVEKVGVEARGVFPGPGGSPTEYVYVCEECRNRGDDPEEVYRSFQPDSDDEE